MKPTPAQIEAAARIIAHNFEGGEQHWKRVQNVAATALTAAAEVDDKTVTNQAEVARIKASQGITAAAEVGEPNYKTWEQADKQDRNATIERCAQVADTWGGNSGLLIAAAIRKLAEPEK